MSAATSGEDYSPWQGWGGHMEDFKVKCLLLNVCCLVRLTVFPELQGSSGTGAVPPRIGVPGGLIPPSRERIKIAVEDFTLVPLLAFLFFAPHHKLNVS